MQILKRAYTTADLANWDISSPSLAVLGYPIEHSLSPCMHNAALQELAKKNPVFQGWRYEKFSIPPEQLAEALPLFKEKNFVGLNLTLPHKVQVLPLLAGVTELASLSGAANTLFLKDGNWHGHNTDGYGMARAIEEDLQLSLADKHIILLGAGGAARAAAVTCLQAGCQSLWIGNRSAERLEELVQKLQAQFASSSGQIHSFLFSSPPDFPDDVLVIQATSSGLKPDDACPLDFTRLAGDVAVFDMIYQPNETVTTRAAKEQGFRATSGLGMLLYQGVAALETWVKEPVDAACMREALLANLVA